MPKEDNFDLMVISLGVDMTVNEIKECIQKMLPVCVVNGRGFCLTISGFDDDPRELWEIPEAIAFMRRLYDLGFIATLEVSTRCKELFSKKYKDIEELPGFGALEIWMAVNNKIELGKSIVDLKEMNEFLTCLNLANKKARQICEEPPYDTGLGDMINKFDNKPVPIPDGNVRHASHMQIPQMGKVMNFYSRKLVKPADLNGQDTLFGGKLLEWLDEECAIFAHCQLDGQERVNLRTKIIGEIDFKAPAFQNDIVEIGVDVIRFGTTSITLRAEVRNKSTKQVILTIDKIVMVTVDGEGKPIPHGCTLAKQ